MARPSVTHCVRGHEFNATNTILLKTGKRACRTCKRMYGKQTIMTRPNAEERFWAKVDKTPGHGPNGDCWVWTACKNWKGYGQLTVNKKVVSTHRFSYQISNPAFDKDLLVMHACDNPACVNPAHLSLGTNADNMADMMAKGRSGLHKITHCKHGHELTESNVYMCKGNIRACRTCKLILASSLGASQAQLKNHNLNFFSNVKIPLLVICITALLKANKHCSEEVANTPNT